MGAARIILVILLFLIGIVGALNRVPASRDGTFFYHDGDGFHYHFNRLGINSIYFQCVQSNCNGRAVFNRFHGFRHTQAHHHGRNMLYAQYRIARQTILGRCKELEHVSFAEILRQEGRICHRRVRGWLRERRVRLAMTRARRQAYPARPANLHGLSDILQDPQYRGLTSTVDGTDNIFAGSVTANDGTHAVIFTSQRLLEFMRNCHTLMSDGTFRSVPAVQNTRQVFVILTTWNFHIIPLVWVLMERRTESLYRAVFAALRMFLGPRWRVRRIITDWERPQRNAWAAICPQATLQGCFWHYCRAILMYAKNRLGLLWWIRNDRFVRGIVRLCCALPLLPNNRYQMRGVIQIARIVRRRGRFYRQLMEPFLTYLWRSWIASRTRRYSLNFYGSFHRTNNACESHNRRLNWLLGIRHPNIYAFIETLRLFEETAVNDIEALEEGRIPSRRRRADAIANDRLIRTLGRGLQHAPDRRRMAILRFLYRAAFSCRRYFNANIFRN